MIAVFKIISNNPFHYCFHFNVINLFSITRKSILLLTLYLYCSSGYSQTGPGGIGSVNGSSSLTLWLQADKNVTYDNLKNIVSWTDYSGNGHVLTSGLGSPVFVGNTLNSMPVVDFMSDSAGLSKTGVTGSDLFSAGNNTILFVKRSVSGSYWFNWQTLPENQISFHVSAGQEIFNFPNNTSGSLTGSASIVSDWHILTNRTDGANQTIFLDGTQDATQPNSGVIDNTLTGNLYLGTFDGTKSNGWIGQIAELIVYNNSLTSARRILVENYLSAKYDLPVSIDKYSGDTDINGNYDHDVSGLGAESDGRNTVSNSAGLYLEEFAADPLLSGEYIISGHSNLLQNLSVANLPSSVQRRWNRIWYIDQTGAPGASVAFDLSEGIDGNIPGDPADYVLLFRSGTSGNFSVVAGLSASIVNTDQIAFDVTSDKLLDGYYTLGTKDQADSPLDGIKTWYNYSIDATDNWDSWERWTTDPDGSQLINPYHLIPGASDDVIIKGGTININDPAKAKTASLIEIKGDGSLILSATSLKPEFDEIKGEGTISIYADNYPGDGTNDSDFSANGTVVYCGNGYSLNSEITYYNLIINLSAPGSRITLKNNITIGNDLTIRQGIFRINDETDNVKYQINVTGDVIIPDSNGSIETGIGDPANGAYSYASEVTMPGSGQFHTIFHNLNIGGDFINHGTAKFTNLTAPLYNEFVSDGAVTVTFTGESNNSISLYGETYFYNLVIDKGNSQAYITTIYSADNTYFNLFGGNAAGINTTGIFNVANPEVRKALFIKNGTLKLTGDMQIHSLSEGNMGGGLGDYVIGANACLWINGSAITAYSTANSDSQAPAGSGGVNTSGTEQGIIIYGKLKISNGNFGTHNSAGIIFRNEATGTLQIEGGTLNVSQIHSSSGGSGKANYIQSGGTVEIRGDRTEDGLLDDTHGIFGLVNSEDNYIISGGDLQINDISTGSGFGNNSFYINSSSDNFDVTGGNVNINVPGGCTFPLYSTARFMNLNLQSVDGNTVTYRMNSDLSISGNLLVDEHTVLDLTATVSARALSIAGDLTIGSDNSSLSYFNTGTGSPSTTIIFNGTGNSEIKINNSRTGIFPLYNFVINKDNVSDTVMISCPLGGTQPVTINGNFTINRGKFDYGQYIVDVKGDLTNLGVMGIWNRQGRIRLNNTAIQQNITGGTASNVLFGHIEIAHTDASPQNVKLNSNASLDLLTLTSGRLFIQNYKLSVDTNYITYSAPATPVNRMIYTTNDHANRGLRLKMDHTYTGSTVTFPLGTYDGVTFQWGNCDVAIGNIGYIEGYLMVAPVPMAHPSQVGGGCTILPYYWKTVATGLPATANGVQYTFISPGPDPNGKEYFLKNGSWIDAGNSSGTLVFENTYIKGFLSSEFTAGKNNCFNGLKTVYSNGTGGGNWNAGASWTGGNPPGRYDIAVIKNGDKININANDQDAGKIIINAGGVFDVGAYTLLNYSIVQGGGTFRIASNTSNVTPVLPVGDFDPFLVNDTAVFEYYGNADYVLPDISYYPSLKIGGNANTKKTLPKREVTVYKDLLIYDDAASGIILALNNENVDGHNLIVKGNIKFKQAGIFRFPATGYARTVTVDGSIIFNTEGNTTTCHMEIEDVAGSYSSFHKLSIGGDILMNTNSIITLFRNTTTRRAVDVSFTGSNNSHITVATNGLLFNTLTISKELETSQVLVDADISFTTYIVKPVTLNKGHLILNNTDISICLSHGAGNFLIPQYGKLSLRSGAIANITGTTTGLVLDGALSIENNSQLIIEDGSNDNFIEYGSSGKSSISVSGTATLTVGSQIRRKLASEAGSLKYSQTGGTVTVGKNSAPVVNRGVFEILKPGGTFTFTGGELIIARGQSSSAPAFYIDPESYTLTGGLPIIFGHSNTPAGSIIGLYSAIPLKDIVVSSDGGDKTVKSFTPELTLDSLIIDNAQAFDANGNDLIFKGNIKNAGLFTAGDNTTSFDGTGQKIRGITTFNNLNILSTDSVVLRSNIFIEGNLSVTSGKLSDCRNTITLEGDYINNGTQFSVNSIAGGVLLKGSVRQKISGTGIFGRLEIDNILGVEILNDFSLVDRNIYMTNGNFYIKQYRLQLGQTANIVSTSGSFSKDKMIVTNGAISDKGVDRAFNGSSTTAFDIPVGVNGKYTPVAVSQIDAVGNGYLEIRPVNQYHPTVLDPSNVLDYYWNIQVTGFVSFKGKLTFQYDQSDVLVNSPGVESDYIPASLSDVNWAKFDSKDIDAISNRIQFNFSSGVNPAGDFTAGISSAIPDEVPVFYTISDGEWEGNIWAREDGYSVAGPPSGYVVKIRNNVEITEPLKYAYKTIIEPAGKLTVGTTIGHYLGEVSGTGTLSISSARLPAGNYDKFFSCTGGTMEFTGDGSYEIPDEGSTYHSLVIKGAGTKTLPSVDLTICSSFLVDGTTADNSIHNRTITLQDSFTLQSGTFKSGTGSSATLVFAGTASQSLSGNFTGTSKLNNITLNNSAGAVIDNNISMSGILALNNGKLTTGSHVFTMDITSSTTPVSGTPTSFVNGPLSKTLASGSNFVFPVGKGSLNGKFSFTNTSTSGQATWTVEYMDSGTPNKANRGSGIAQVSDEYWIVTPPTGTSPVTLRWNEFSNINGLSAGGMSNIRLVKYSGTSWDALTSTVTAGSTDINGTITTDSTVSFSSGVAAYFSLGSFAELLPSANFVSTNLTICKGESVDLQISLTNGTSWTLYYTEGGTPKTKDISTTLYLLNATPLNTTTYTLTDVENELAKHGNATGSLTVTVNDKPSVIVTDPATVCSPATVDLTVPAVTAGSTPGSVYTYWLNASATQVFSNPATAVAGTYYIKGTNAAGCYDVKPVVSTVNPAPNATIAYAGLPWCPNAGAQAVTLTGTSGGQFTAPAALSIDLLSGTILPVASTPDNYTVTYAIAPAGGCGPFTTTTTVSINPEISWTGSVNNDWTLPGNWSCGLVPGQTTIVRIPDQPSDPVIPAGSTGSVNNLTISTGSSLTVSGNLNISGNITNSGLFSIHGTLRMNGGAPQVIPVDVFDGDSLRNLSIDNAAGVTLQGIVNVTRSVKLDNGDLASNGNLVLVSKPGSTAFIYGSTNNVTGDVTMQRYLDVAYGYSYFSSPFQAATVSELVPEITLGASFPLLYRYVEDRNYFGTPLSGWEKYDVAGNVLQLMQGYSVNFPNNTPLTVEIKGAVNNGTRSITLYNHNQQYTQGFNLVGNPYPSPIDWNAVAALNPDIDNAVYLFEGTDRYTGLYHSFVNGIPAGKGSNIIPAMQGFFVHVPDPVAPAVYPTSAVLNMDNSVRIADTKHEFLKKSSKQTKQAETERASTTSPAALMRITAGFSGSTLDDPLVIYFNNVATGRFDRNMDAIKLFNTTQSAPNFYSLGEDNSKLAINALPSTIDGIPDIPLGIRTKKNGQVVFRVKDIEGFMSGGSIYLYDAMIGTSTDISTNEYSVSLNTGIYDNRFFLRFGNLMTGLESLDHNPFSVYVSGNKLYAEINSLSGKEGMLKISNISGQSVFAEQIYENGHYKFNLSLNDGIYVVTFITGDFRYSQKIIVIAQ